MGGVSDDAQEYYKLQFAEEIGPLLESPDNGLALNAEGYLEALIRSAREWTEMTGDPNMARWIRAVQAADKSFGSEADFVRNYLTLRQEEARRTAAEAGPKTDGAPASVSNSKFKPAVFEVLQAYQGTEALKKFDLFAKAYQLRHVWKLEPVFMQKVSQTYGPVDLRDLNRHFSMDWRHPDSHAIYWALKGLDIAEQEKNRSIDTEEVNTDRIVLHSLQNLFRYGKILIFQGWENSGPKTADATEKPQPVLRKDVYLGPDPRIFDSYEKAYRAVYGKYEADRGRKESFENGHRNMLKNAVLLFYQAGLKSEAVKIYNRLRQQYPLEEFKVSLEQFAREPHYGGDGRPRYHRCQRADFFAADQCLWPVRRRR